MEDTKQAIRKFLKRFFRKREITDNEDIFELGFVNSLFAMQLVMFIEKEFKLKISNKDLNFDNFRTIQSMSDFIEERL